MKELIFAGIISIFFTCGLYSQNKSIKGRVVSTDLEPMAFAIIMFNDTVQVGKTDFKGYFQINIPVSGKELQFMNVGMEPAKIILADSCDEVEVVMMLSGTYDFMTLKKADRLRLKAFKKLPELHKAAFLKGLFKTAEACYTREFIRHNRNR